MVMKIIIADNLHPDAISLLEEKDEFEIIKGFEIEDFDLKNEIKDVTCIIVRSKTKLTREIIEAGEMLRLIARAGIGVDNIDLDAATERNIPVINAPKASTETVADLTMGLIIALARKIVLADKRLRKGIWKKSDLLGRELSSLKLGIVGFGRIGEAVARRARAFGMDVCAYDAYIPMDVIEEKGVKFLEFRALLKECDVISIHVPYTKETAGMFSHRAFDIMKEGAYLINVSRGGVVDESALLNALKKKKLAGAAIDVFEVESGIHPIFKFENVVVTPHIGASTIDAQRKVGIEIAEAVIGYLLQGSTIRPVNRVEL